MGELDGDVGAAVGEGLEIREEGDGRYELERLLGRMLCACAASSSQTKGSRVKALLDLASDGGGRVLVRLGGAALLRALELGVDESTCGAVAGGTSL